LRGGSSDSVHIGIPGALGGPAPYNDRYAGKGGTTNPSFRQLGPWLTTPVAYVTTLPPFEKGFESRSWSTELSPCVHMIVKTATFLLEGHGAFSAADRKTIEEDFGRFLLLSRGPGGTLGEGDGTYFTDFNPTYGSESAGNIIVGQERSSLLSDRKCARSAESKPRRPNPLQIANRGAGTPSSPYASEPRFTCRDIEASHESKSFSS